MSTTIQEISFEVATKNETVAVAVKPPALAEQLPPLTTEQRELLKQAHPSLQAQLERSLRRKNQREQQKQPTTAKTTDNRNDTNHNHDTAQVAQTLRRRLEKRKDPPRARGYLDFDPSPRIRQTTKPAGQ